jgi:NAD+ synthase
VSLEDKIKIADFKYGPEHAAIELAEQILQWTAGTGANGAVIGLSGGIDSTTTAYLTKFAFDTYNRANPDKKPLKLLGLMLPSKANNLKDAKDGIRVAESLGIEYKVIPIQEMADAFIQQIPEVLTDNFDIGNLYSELRAVTLSRYGAANNYRVMGTGNRDEDYILGYFTKRGDGAVDNNILGNLPKRLVRKLAAWFDNPKVPEDLVNRIPTAGLWENQTDEGELGYNYDQAEIIQNGYDEGKTPEQIQGITGYDMGIILDVDKRHRSTEHKRQLPPVGQVTLEYK